MSVIKRLWLLIFVILFFGCAGTAPKYITIPKATGEEATVYVYWPSRFFKDLRVVTVMVKDVATFSLSNGSYVVLSLPPGKHRFLIEWSFWSPLKNIDRVFRFEALKSYYIKYDVSGFMLYEKDLIVNTVSNNLFLVDETTGTTDIKECKLLK